MATTTTTKYIVHFIYSDASEHTRTFKHLDNAIAYKRERIDYFRSAIMRNGTEDDWHWHDGSGHITTDRLDEIESDDFWIEEQTVTRTRTNW